jgi:hypothetical protein
MNASQDSRTRLEGAKVNISNLVKNLQKISIEQKLKNK